MERFEKRWTLRGARFGARSSRLGRLVRTNEGPVDFLVQVFATHAGQLLDGWAVFSRDAVDQPLLNDLVPNRKSIRKSLEGREL